METSYVSSYTCSDVDTTNTTYCSYFSVPYIETAAVKIYNVELR